MGTVSFIHVVVPSNDFMLKVTERWLAGDKRGPFCSFYPLLWKQWEDFEVVLSPRPTSPIMLGGKEILWASNAVFDDKACMPAA